MYNALTPPTLQTKQEWNLLSKWLKNPQKFKDPGGKFSSAAQYINATYPEGRDFSERAAMHRNGVYRIPRCVCGEKVSFNYSAFKWAKNCGGACYRSRILTNNERVEVNGIVYDSLARAKKAYKGNLIHDLYNCDVDFVRFVEDHEEKCKERLRKNSPKLLDVGWLKEQRKSGTIYEIADNLGICRESVNNALLFHGIPLQFLQMPQTAYDILADDAKFSFEFATFGSERMASEYGCSPSTILKKAHELNLPVRRFTSAIELTLKEYIESLGFEVLQSDKSILGNRDVDLHIPSRNVAIELDGLYFHTEKEVSHNQERRHVEKYLRCKERGVTLLRFTDIETTRKLDIVKSMIAAKLGVSRKIYARQCKVVTLTAPEARAFCNANHISGWAAAREYLALQTLDGEIVHFMSFGKPRFSKKYDWELVRMCSALGTTVIGGASKLLSAFRKRNAGTIMSYSDNRFGNGNSYAQLGFSLVKETSPGYCYVKKNTIYSRYLFQKRNIQKVCAIYNPALSERENAFANGFWKYWDCGNKVWELI